MTINTKSRTCRQFRVIFTEAGVSCGTKWMDSKEDAESWADLNCGPCQENVAIVSRVHTEEAFPVADFLAKFAS